MAAAHLCYNPLNLTGKTTMLRKKLPLIALLFTLPVVFAVSTGLAQDSPSHTPAPTPFGGGTGKIGVAGMETTREDYEIFIMDADGSKLDQLTLSIGATAAADNFAWSPDGNHFIYVSNKDGDRELYLTNSDRRAEYSHRQLTDNEYRDSMPVWSPDGNKIAFSSNRDGGDDIYVINIESGDTIRLTDHDGIDHWPSWSPDGSKIAYASETDTRFDIYVMDADGSNRTQLTDDQAGDLFPSWSPDGTKIVYVSVRNREYKLYMMDEDGSNQMEINSELVVFAFPRWQPAPQ
jgi:tol-pal system beta propeller repeat protein TolB